MLMRMGQCVYFQEPVFSEEITQYDLAEIQQDAALMAKTALLMRTAVKRKHVTLPVVDEPLFRSVGIQVTSNWTTGISLPEYHYPTPQSLSEFKGFTCNPNILAPLFEAITLLKAQGEQVVVEIPGAYACLNALMAYENMILATRQNKTAYAFIMAETADVIRAYMVALDNAGCDYIYLADAVGGVELMGPKFYRKHYAPTMMHILSVLTELKQTELLLCPRTFIPLEALGWLVPDDQGLIRAAGCVGCHLNPAIGRQYSLRLPVEL